ncbi:MAG: LuxR C-terminal-related transcriptional regulator, partial [Anaerolineales bacterium]
QTKLQTPPLRRELVPRPGLLARLGSGVGERGGFAHRLTLVSAPAGYGKTTLVVEWLKDVELHASWLSLDAEDNDSARFLAYLIASLQKVDPALGGTSQAMLQSPQPPPMEAVLTALLNEITALASPFILVLDDYHLIETPTIHQQVNFILEHQPDQMHLVILTRADPPLPIHRMRARSQVNEIRQDDMSFTIEEAIDFLDRIMGLNLNQEDISRLLRRTEGWVTGLQLAALSMRGQVNVQQFVHAFTGSNRYVLDYLFEEVFNRQSAQVQEFLLKSAVLNRLCAPLCDAVTGREDAQGTLETLENSNLFIVPLDQSRTWYRYHHLFLDLLRHRLHRQGDVSEQALHKKAGRWYWENNLQAEAVHHALAGEDWDAAGELIHQLLGEMLKRGEIATLLKWFGKLPQETLHAQPQLCLDYSWPLILSGQYEAAETLLERAEQSSKKDKIFLGEIATAQAYLARSLGDAARTIELSQRALSLLPETDLATRANLSVNMGLAYWHTGQIAEAEPILARALHGAHETGNQYGALAAQIFLARVLAVRGELRQAAESCHEILQAAGDVPLAVLTALDLSAIYYEWNQFDRAADYLARGLGLGERSAVPEFKIANHIMQARLNLGQGRIGTAIETLQKSHKQVPDAGIPAQSRARRAACHVEVAIAASDLAEAEIWANQVGTEIAAHSHYRFLGLTHARLLIAQEQVKAAAQHLETCVQQAKHSDWGYGLVAARVLQTLAAQDMEAALRYLSQALDLAHPEGYLRTFADAGTNLVPVLQEAAGRGTHPEYVGQILAAMEDQTTREGAAVPQKGQALVEPLSEREMEVLRLVAAGLSNREIARKLVISLGTAKTHIHNIYGKLEVRNRAQCVARARDLRLI